MGERPPGTHLSGSVLALVLGFTLGFYVGALAVLLAVGEAAFNAAMPNPWREAFCLPMALAVWCYWKAIW